IRRAWNIGFDTHIGRHTISPEFSHSKEDDYESFAYGLNYALDLNQKNTTVRLGASHSCDEVNPAFFTKPEDKESTDFLAGISQILSRNTVFTADFTYGISSGYLNDPYKSIRFDGWTDFLP